MSIPSQAVKAAGAGSGAKAADPVVGPPWSSKIVAPPKTPAPDQIAAELSKFKAASGSLHVSDAKADFLALTLALQEGRSAPANSNEPPAVGNDGLSKIVGPPWSPKEFKQAPLCEAKASGELLDTGYVPKRG